MDTNELTGKIKNNILNIVIIGLAVLLALKFAANNKKSAYMFKKDKERESEKSKILDEISKLESTFEEVKKKINGKDLSGLLNRVDELAKLSAVKIVSVKPNNEESHKYYTRLSYDLTVSAENYHAIARFVSKLEHSPDVFLIENIDIARQSSEEQGSVSARLSLGTILVKD